MSVELISEFERNPGGETIRVERDGEHSRVTIATKRADGTISDNSFACHESHLPKLIAALSAACGPRLH